MAKELPRDVKCDDCGFVWSSQAMAKNLKCKKCRSESITDNYIDPTCLNGQELPGIERETCDDTCEFFDNDICSLMPERKCNQSTTTPTVEEIDTALEEADDPDLDEAKKDLEAAKATEEDAASKVKDAEALVKSKTPPPCVRCNGDGFWHSPKTGYRAKTASEPLIDTDRTCPLCK
jgi:hypothetical protein